MIAKSKIAMADRRDQCIFGQPYRPECYRGGLRYFKALHRHELRRLLNARIFDPYPWRQYMEYVWFMEKFGHDDKLFFHGFVYGPDRKDGFHRRQGGICIEGIGRSEKWKDGEEGEQIFKYLFESADQFELDPPYVWFD